MVINVPDSFEFMQKGIGLFNQAWDLVYDLSFEVRRPLHGEWDQDQVLQYWQTAQPRLRTALALVQQGAELALKGRIASVSPFVLIAGDPGRWPRPHSRAISFAEFRTIDALDLPKVHDLFSPTPLPETYWDFYEHTRRLRNESVHGVTASERLTDVRLFEDILRHFRHLHEGKRWPTERLAYHSSNPLAELHSSDHAIAFTLMEIDLAVDILSPGVLKEEFGFDKKNGRTYICPHCFNKAGSSVEFADGFVRLAKLKPNTRASSEVYCFVCDRTSKADRVGCGEEECPGDVIATGSRICLTCGQKSGW